MKHHNFGPIDNGPHCIYWMFASFWEILVILKKIVLRELFHSLSFTINKMHMSTNKAIYNFRLFKRPYESKWHLSLDQDNGLEISCPFPGHSAIHIFRPICDAVSL